MFLNPQISKQLADEHRRDLMADARQQSFARQVQAGSGTGTGTGSGSVTQRQSLSYRLWRRLRPVTSPRLEPQV